MKFYGKIGFSVTKEDSENSGVWTESIVEKMYYGDFTRLSKQSSSGSQLNDNFTINGSFSILLDSFAMSNYSHIRYVEFMGTKWKISTVEIQYPRINLTTGGIFNGE